MAGAMTTIMRAANTVSVGLYRATKGKLMAKVRGLPVLLFTVAGRKTGQLHTTPVAYFTEADRYLVVGSAGGMPTEPNWFRNLRAAETATIEIGDRRIDVAVAVIGPQERPTLWRCIVDQAPFFQRYQDKVQREIPLARLTPR